MNRLFLALIFVCSSWLTATAAEKANTVVVHLGEVIYARFEQKGTKIKLLATSKTKDEAAQVVMSLQREEKKPGLILKVENHFTRDLLYKVEMRSLTRKQRFPAPSSPVVAGKVALESFPPVVEEIAAFGFALEK